MRRSLVVACSIVACWAFATPPAQGQSQLTAKDAWARATPSVAQTSAAFMVLHNAGARDVSIVSARSPAARVVEIHETRDDNGIVRMRRVDALTVPGGGSVTLKPGGYHLMLIDLTAPLAPGTRVTLTLTLSDGSTLDVVATARPLS